MTSATRIADRYELIVRLGQGGMGVVWSALDTRLGREIALKEVKLPQGMGDEERTLLRERVMREARTAAGLAHPGAVTVFDVIDEDERIYIAMELVDAPTLSELVEKNGSLSPERAARVALDLLDVLEAAHAQGIVHRDVKPANVMITKNDRAKLADFGIAVVTDDPKLTASGYILGSPAYMAPEQAEGKRSQPATDLWGLGVTLYFALMGRSPFSRNQPIATLQSVINDDVVPPEGPLSGVISDLLAKDPADRPTPAELRPRLQHLRDAPSLPGAVPPVEAPAPRTAEAEPRARRSRLAMVLAGLTLLIAAAATGVMLLGGNEESGPLDRGSGSGGQEENVAASGTVPEGWIVSKDLPRSHSVAFPEGWEVVVNSIGDDSSVDFRDPSTGAYMRVDWTGTPGTDVVGTAENFEDGFATRVGDYQRVRLKAATFQGFEAVDWEYTFTDGG
ncbi:MAG: serine/threonine-protein kinase, partial [Actinomycetota bacterium]